MTLEVSVTTSLPRGTVAMPATQTMATRCVQSLFGVVFGMPPGSRLDLLEFGAGGTSIADSRNFIVQRFLAAPNGGEWLLMCDSDVTVPCDVTVRLLQHNADVVSPLFFLRTPPFMAGLQLLDPTVDATRAVGVHEALWVGAACMMIRRHVLEAITPPWFQPIQNGRGEDIWFCRRAREARFRIWADCDIAIQHIGLVGVGRELADAWQHSPTGLQQLAVERARG